MLDIITQTTEKLTIVFNAHGGPNGIYFTGGFNSAIDGNDWNRITPQNLAVALEKRHHLSQEMIASGGISETKPQEPVIFIFHSCYSYNFMRNVYKKMTDGVPKPTALVASEFGQTPYCIPGTKFGSWNMEGNILQTLPHQEGPATIGNFNEEVFQENPFYNLSKPGVITTDEDNQPIQISWLEERLEDTRESMRDRMDERLKDAEDRVEGAV